MRRSRIGFGGAVIALVVGAAALASCDTDDGREMRPPTSYQEWVLQGTSPSTAPTTVPIVPEITVAPPTLVAVPTGVGSQTEGSEGLGSDTALPGAPTTTTGVSSGVSLDASTEDSADASTAAAPAAPLSDLAASGVVFAAPFASGSELNPAYTCDGAGINPQLTWTAPPAGTVELAVAVVDPDATQADGGPFVHYLVVGLPASPGTVGGNNPSQLGHEATNSAGTVGWTPPCPPAGERHTYEFTLYALDQQTELPTDAPPSEQLDAIRAAATGAATVTATYERSSVTSGS